jgi:hypothetical protein
MKQAEDNKTIDMLDAMCKQPQALEVRRAVYALVMEPIAKPTKPTYRFIIKTDSGATLAWSNLTLREAQAMNKLMNKHNPLQSSVNVSRFGWEEV